MKRTALYLTIVALIAMFSSYGDVHAQDRGEKLYVQTLELYKSLAADPSKVNNKEIWNTIARAFYSIYSNYGNSEKAPNSLFLSGKMYEEMGDRFKSQDDLNTAVEYSRLFVKRYPDSNLADDAQLRLLG
ncbi:MAG: hypothetical protein R3B51_02500 [Thermodesulfobacteriota bacterium]